MDGICKFCGKSIWQDTDGWRHDSTGTMPICNSKPEPREGKTLADFADSGKAFKRPHHALVFAFMETSGFLKEFDVEEGNPTLARLTAEDLTATDWQEVRIFE
jgi:hypothetical protein